MSDLLAKYTVVFVLVLFAVFFPIFWCFVVWLIAKVGGWSRLARDYQARNKPHGRDFSMLSLRIPPFTGYNGCLQVTFCAEGIYMVPLVIFRVGHQPLLIPWSKIGPLQTGKILWMPYASFPLEIGGKTLRLTLNPAARQWLEQNPNYRDFAPKLTRVPGPGF